MLLRFTRTDESVPDTGSMLLILNNADGATVWGQVIRAAAGDFCECMLRSTSHSATDYKSYYCGYFNSELDDETTKVATWKAFATTFDPSENKENKMTLTSSYEEFWGVTAMRGYQGKWFIGGAVKSNGVPKFVLGRLNKDLIMITSRSSQGRMMTHLTTRWTLWSQF